MSNTKVEIKKLKINRKFSRESSGKIIKEVDSIRNIF